MATPSNVYLTYKRDVRYLLYWLIHTQNGILRSTASEADETTAEINTTGQTTLADLVSMSELIAQHLEPVPPVIYCLFQSIIKARTRFHGVIQTLATTDKDFIESLSKAFNVLGGEAWLSNQNYESDRPELQSEKAIEEVVFADKFKALNVKDEEEGGGSPDGMPQLPQQQQVRCKKASKKSKKSKKKTKKSKKKQKKEDELESVPLESYKIIEDEEATATDYLMAAHAAAGRWVDLRAYCRDLWREVAYRGLNSAVAGAISNMAICMIKNEEATIFGGFPAHTSYETIIDTITRGNFDKIHDSIRLALSAPGQSSQAKEATFEGDVDVKELLLTYAYEDLVDFVTDFQKNGTGKPTKAMKARLSDWDPDFDLKHATDQQRLHWRQTYTINWLYDLVNIFSSNEVQENSLKSKRIAYDNVGWSPSDSRDRRLFGLVEFANFVTSLAMKKQGSYFKHDIMPYRVFQLQCIVDSMTVSRGWSWSAFRGQVLEAPAVNFRPRRDVNLFLDRENRSPGSGYLKGISVLQQTLQQKEVSHGNIAGHVSIAVVLEHIKRDLTNWLGESKYMHGLEGVPPSRFSKTNANGLWEYSPFLCGTGLAGVLQLAYTLGMTLWDRNPEPMMAIHIHNMLVQKGVIDKPVLLYEGLQALFKDIVFVSGIAPTDRFEQDLQVKLTSDEELSHFIKRKSSLILYELARWDPDAIPDSEVVVPSPLFMQRLDRMKISVNPRTGEDYLEDCDLVCRAKQSGVTQDEVFEFMATRKRIQDGMSTPESSDDGENRSTEDSKTLEIEDKNRTATEPRTSSDADSKTPRALLDWVKHDLLRDVNGRAPLSSVNYLWVAARFMLLFNQVEERLETLRNPVYIQIYGTRGPSVGEKRVSLTLTVLSGQDEECLKVFAEEIEILRSSFLDHVYWEGLEVKDDDDMFRPGMAKACDAKDQDVCRVM